MADSSAQGGSRVLVCNNEKLLGIAFGTITLGGGSSVYKEERFVEPVFFLGQKIARDKEFYITAIVNDAVHYSYKGKDYVLDRETPFAPFECREPHCYEGMWLRFDRKMDT